MDFPVNWNGLRERARLNRSVEKFSKLGGVELALGTRIERLNGLQFRARR
jgi:hypothetical protein